jgi:hypothetical protein
MFDYTADMRWYPEILLFAGLLSAETGVKPRPAPADFPIHEGSEPVAIGAEFMVHSFGRDSERYVNEDYLTVEVGVFPAKGTAVVLSNSQFTLRINGKKNALSAVTPSMVASSLKYSDWEQRPQADPQAGPVTIGRPQNGPRFPGDNRPAHGRLPADGPGLSASEQGPAGPTHVAPSVLVREVALQEGEHKFPTGGYLYFPYRGKIKSIRSLELIYDNGSESITLRLR